MIEYVPALIVLLLFILGAVLGYVDRRKYAGLDSLPAVSFIIPCYNDAATVGETIASVYQVYGKNADLIVVDDCSTDGSEAVLENLQRRYGFVLMRNSRNLGKSRTLNEVAGMARQDILLFVDADVIVNEAALHDALARLRAPGTGAVSCPYVPENHGLIPLMQHIEYNMLSFIQGAYNRFSAIALWGGFIAVRREAFRAAGGFTLNAITEDMDLAYKLNWHGWRVEQSFVPVHAYVPDSALAWFKQKIRWSSGGFQCFVRYPQIWVRNPLHVLFMAAFCLLLTSKGIDIVRDVIMWEDIIAYFNALNASLALDDSLRLTRARFGLGVSMEIMMRVAFMVFSLPFVWPLVAARRRPLLLLLVIPFSVLYLPIYSLISIGGAVIYLHRRKLLSQASRAW